jgi:hypothetical protein
MYTRYSRNTLEEEIDKLINRKRGISEKVIRAATTGERKWMHEELLEILAPFKIKNIFLKLVIVAFYLIVVDWRGIEPLTSAMPRRRYTANLPAQPTQDTGTNRLNIIP